MKTTIISIAAALFSAGVSAADVYQGIDNGNSDLSSQRVSEENYVAVQPGVGDSVNRYQGFADGNLDLFKSDSSGTTGSGVAPDIYGGVSGNPDLQF